MKIKVKKLKPTKIFFLNAIFILKDYQEAEDTWLEPNNPFYWKVPWIYFL